MPHPKDEQCKHTFAINQPACRACAGWNQSCPGFVPVKGETNEAEKGAVAVQGGCGVHDLR